MPKTILVADDEPYVLRSLEFILKKEGYRVLTATDGQEVDRLQALESGADEFITKPYSPRKLVDRVREILGPSA